MAAPIQHYDPAGEPLENGMWYPGQYLGWDLQGNWVEEGYSALSALPLDVTLDAFKWADVSDIFAGYTPIQEEEDYLEMLGDIETIGFFKNLLQGIAGTDEYDPNYVDLMELFAEETLEEQYQRYLDMGWTPYNTDQAFVRWFDEKGNFMGTMQNPYYVPEEDDDDDDDDDDDRTPLERSRNYDLYIENGYSPDVDDERCIIKWYDEDGDYVCTEDLPDCTPGGEDPPEDEEDGYMFYRNSGDYYPMVTPGIRVKFYHRDNPHEDSGEYKSVPPGAAQTDNTIPQDQMSGDDDIRGAALNTPDDLRNKPSLTEAECDDLEIFGTLREFLSGEPYLLMNRIGHTKNIAVWDSDRGKPLVYAKYYNEELYNVLNSRF